MARETIEEKSARLYRFIYDCLYQHAKAPSRREMTKHMRCSTETLAKLLDHLEHNGRGLRRVRGCARRLWVPINDMPEE